MSGSGGGGTPARLRREMGRRSLLFLSIGAIIGSGWLFAGLDAAKAAGGSSVLAWVLAGGMVISLALVHAELGTMFPVDGGTARFPLYAFGRVTGFVSGWAAWVAAACIAPIETHAALRYASNYLPWLTHLEGHEIELSAAGIVVGAVVMLGFTVLNLAGIREFRDTNSVVVVWKVALPIFVAISLIVVSFQPHNFAVGGFLAGGPHGVIDALSTGGVIFALIGFEQAVQLGGETRHPQRAIPFAVIGAVVIGGAVYLLLQVAFVGAMPASSLEHGWSGVHFQGIFGPYAGLAEAIGATVAAYMIYVAAVISPAGTGLTYTATSSRVPFALAREGYLPKVFARLNSRDVPWVGLAVTYLGELVIIITFRNWDELLRFSTTSLVLVYALAPLSLAVLRRTSPGHRRPYFLPGAGFISRVAFCVANLIIIWNGWTNDRVLYGTVTAGLLICAALAAVRRHFRHHPEEWVSAAWIFPYVLSMLILSWVSPYHGGEGWTNPWVSILLVVVVSLGVYELAVRLGIGAHRALPAGERPADRWHRTVSLMEAAEQ